MEFRYSFVRSHDKKLLSNPLKIENMKSIYDDKEWNEENGARVTARYPLATTRRDLQGHVKVITKSHVAEIEMRGDSSQ